MPLQLRYAFNPTPNPIRASAEGSNPNLVDLEVVVSNSTMTVVSFLSVQIKIPTGDNIAADLSATRDLPSPQYDTSGPWLITASGSTVTIQSKTGGSAPLTSSILFRLSGIVVNSVPGVVPLTITEIAPPAPKVVDSTTYSLAKFESDFPVTDFRATPTVLYDLNQVVTLTWTGSDRYVYNLHSDSWHPKDCLRSGNCFTARDGQAGVQPPPLVQDTTFALDVIKTNPDGSRQIVNTLYTSVRVVVPRIVQNSYVEVLLGCIMDIHWIALNADERSATMSGTTLVRDLPADTYNQGYLLPAPQISGDYTLTLTAKNAQSRARATDPFAVTFKSKVLATGQQPWALAITPDSAFAFVTNTAANNVLVVDLVRQTIESNTIPVGARPMSISISADGRYALVGNYQDTSVTLIDVPTRTKASEIWIGYGARSVAVTPDGTLGLAVGMQRRGTFYAYLLSFINIPDRKEEKSIEVGQWPVAVVITPDGQTGLVVNQDYGIVTVIDIPKRSAAGTIKVGNSPTGIAITPDGKYALVANQNSAFISVIDIAKRSSAPNIEAPFGGLQISISPDGRMALLSATSISGVALLDLVQKTRSPRTLPTGVPVFAPNGLVAAYTSGDAVVVLGSNATQRAQRIEQSAED